jgi:hypothetical protein
MTQVLSIEERIAQSIRARAVERAWNVAKALEGDRVQIDGLEWVSPIRVEGRGPRRPVDFSTQFPEEPATLLATPMDIGIIAPADILVPGEDIGVQWTMPLLTRMRRAPRSLDSQVRQAIQIGHSTPVSLRHTIDVVGFLPFPRVGAPAEEQFKPEFMVYLYINADLGLPENRYAAVAMYNGKVVKQWLMGNDPRTICVFADPEYRTHFSAEMLVTLSAEELAATPKNAGELEIYVYRLTRENAPIIPRPRGQFFNLSEYLGNISPSRGLSLGSIDTPRGGDGYKGGSDSYLGITRSMGSTPSWSPVLHNGGGQSPSLPNPAAVPKQVGDVRVGEGTAQEAVAHTVVT